MKNSLLAFYLLLSIITQAQGVFNISYDTEHVINNVSDKPNGYMLQSTLSNYITTEVDLNGMILSSTTQNNPPLHLETGVTSIGITLDYYENDELQYSTSYDISDAIANSISAPVAYENVDGFIYNISNYEPVSDSIPIILILKLDQNGDEIWRNTYTAAYPYVSTLVTGYGRKIEPTMDGGIIIGYTTNSYSCSVLRIDSDGNEVVNAVLDNTPYGGTIGFGEFSNGNTIVLSRLTGAAGLSGIYTTVKIFDTDGALVCEGGMVDLWYAYTTEVCMSLDKTELIIFGKATAEIGSTSENYLGRFKEDCSFEYIKVYPFGDAEAYFVSESTNGGYNVAGTRGGKSWFMHTDENGEDMPVPGITAESSDGVLTINNLQDDFNTKVFDSNFNVVWECNTWSGTPCSTTETIAGLEVGATYYISAESELNQEWIPIIIVGDNCTDNDNDGFCEADDCDDSDPNFPQATGTSCDDGNDTTENDQIQSDGCTCLGTPTDETCALTVSQANGEVSIEGLTVEANAKVFDADYNVIWECNSWSGTLCSANETLTGLTVGATYYLSVESTNCQEWIPIVPENSNDCSASYSYDDSSVTVSGLTNTASVLLMNANWEEVYFCNFDCTNTVTIPISDPESHIIKIKLFDDNYELICEIYEMVDGSSLRISDEQNKKHTIVDLRNQEEEIPLQAIEYTLFPNPANDILHLTIEGKIETKMALRIFNMRGKLVKTVNYIVQENRTQLSIDISELSGGLYFIMPLSEELPISQLRFIKA